MLWVLISVDELSDEEAMACESVLLTVEVDDSIWLGVVMVGMEVATGCSFTVADVGGADLVAVGVLCWSEDGDAGRVGDGIERADRGSRLFFSLIDMTIFSRSMGVM